MNLQDSIQDINMINKTMDRQDLLTQEGDVIVHSINDLIKVLYSKGLYMTSWYGSLPDSESGNNIIKNTFQKIWKKAIGEQTIGADNRGPDYEALLNMADDKRIPWYLYWEIFWVLKNGPKINSNMRLLDAGGTASLFTCYLASLGAEVHSIDINERLVSNGNDIAEKMAWRMFSYAMDMRKLSFDDNYFDHAYSICVFEHLTYEIKQAAISEMARCLKPGGILSITFDYRNPAPVISGSGLDNSEENQLKTEEDIKRNFLSTDFFELIGNHKFYDNKESYLVHPKFNNTPYTFGAIFLRKKS